MGRRHSVFGVMAALMFLAGAGEARGQEGGLCRRTGYRIDNAVRAVEQMMTVSRDGRCGSAITGTRLEDQRLDRRPVNGRVEFDGINYVYMPNRGYVGGDRFVVSWINRDSNARVTATINVRVEPPGASSAGAPSGPSSGSATRSSTGASGAQPAAQSSRTCRYVGNGPMTQQARFGAGTLTVSRDWNCRVWMGGGWSAAGIETAPANGRVEVNGGSWTYVPNPGFTGSDRFALNYNLAGTRIVNSVDVTIVP